MNTENKYQNGKIYKIVSDQTENVYIGSTIEKTLSNRLAGHRKSYKCWLNGKCNYCTSFEIVKLEDAKIILIENYPCQSKYELTSREQFHIENNQLCANKNKANSELSKEEYRKKYQEDNKDELCKQRKKYYDENKEKIQEQAKRYYSDNAEKIKEQYNTQERKKRYENKKDAILEQCKKYYLNNIEKKQHYYLENKEKINKYKSEGYTCECGGTYTNASKSRHMKTRIHEAYLCKM